LNRVGIVFLTLFLVTAVDQWLKIWVKTNLYIGESAVDFGFMEIYFIENNGMAFGTELGGTIGKLALTLFRLAAIVALGFYIYNLMKKRANTGLLVAISLIIAGAFGNLVDSLFYGILFNESPEYFFRDVIPPAEMFPAEGGYAPFMHGKVVDMLHVTLNWPEWVPGLGGSSVFPPVFNVADTSITVGVFMILIWQKRYFPKRKKEDEPASSLLANQTQESPAEPGTVSEATPDSES
jgi:signal peptidase II